MFRTYAYGRQSPVKLEIVGKIPVEETVKTGKDVIIGVFSGDELPLIE